MPEVSTLFSGVQIGVETTSGTAVSASKLLNYLSLEPGISINFNRFRPMGTRVATAVTPGQDFTEWNVSGAGSYSEMIYPLNAVLSSATVTTVETTARLWTFTPPGRSEMSPKTFTVEVGSATRAQKATYVLFNGIEITFNRTDGVTLGGSAIGQQIQDNITLTGSPTAVEDKPILPTHLDCYLDSTSGGIGGTKLTRDFNAVFRHNDTFGAVWPINSTLSSFAAHVDTEPTCQVELTVAADSQGMGPLGTYGRLGATAYIRLAAIAPAAYGFAGAVAAPYEVLIDFAGKVSDINAFDDNDGVKVLTYTFDAIYDSAWGSGQYCKVQVQNKTTAL